MLLKLCFKAVHGMEKSSSALQSISLCMVESKHCGQKCLMIAWCLKLHVKA